MNELCETRRMLVDFLTEEGFRPAVDDEGIIRFQSEGGRYILMWSESDVEYMRLCYPNFWQFDGDGERRAVVRTCNECNRRCKGVKLFTTDDDTWATAEMLINPTGFPAVFMRCMESIRYAVHLFQYTLRKLTEEV